MAIAILPPLRPISTSASPAERAAAFKRAVRELYDANPRHRGLIIKRLKQIRRASR